MGRVGRTSPASPVEYGGSSGGFCALRPDVPINIRHTAPGSPTMTEALPREILTASRGFEPPRRRDIEKLRECNTRTLPHKLITVHADDCSKASLVRPWKRMRATQTVPSN